MQEPHVGVFAFVIGGQLRLRAIGTVAGLGPMTGNPPETSSPADRQMLSLGRVAVQRGLFPVVHSPNGPWQEGG